MARIGRIALLGCALALCWVGSVAASAGNLSNPGFEAGDLGGWQLGTVVDFAGVVGPDGFAQPNEGARMVRLGSPRKMGQPVGSNIVYQDFTAVEPLLSFTYQIFTYDYDGYDHFHYRLLDLETGNTIKYFAQGAWGAVGALKSSGWQTVTLELSGYVGKRLRLELDCGGMVDEENPTWAYVDAPRVTVPTTGASVSPNPNGRGWNNSDVTVALSVASEGSKPVEIHYSVDGGPEVVAAGPVVSFTLASEGVHKILYFAHGEGGAVESDKSLMVKIDKTKPSIAVRSPSSSPYLTSASLALDSAISDALSGVESGQATMDGVPVSFGQVIELAKMAGKHLLRVAALDVAGNSDVKLVEFEVRIAAVVDLKPDSLSLSSESEKNGLSAYVEFPAGYDVKAVDPTSIKLEVGGKLITAQVKPTALDDYDGDGAVNRMVKFDRQAVAEALGENREEFTGKVTGTTADGRNFEGVDTVKIVAPTNR